MPDSLSAHFTVASDEDCERGFLLVEEGLPEGRDALLGLFVVLARREWGIVYDSERLTLSKRPKGYRLATDGERMVSARKTADSHWWIIEGLLDAECQPRQRA